MAEYTVFNFIPTIEVDFDSSIIFSKDSTCYGMPVICNFPRDHRVPANELLWVAVTSTELNERRCRLGNSEQDAGEDLLYFSVSLKGYHGFSMLSHLTCFASRGSLKRTQCVTLSTFRRTELDFDFFDSGDAITARFLLHGVHKLASLLINFISCLWILFPRTKGKKVLLNAFFGPMPKKWRTNSRTGTFLSSQNSLATHACTLIYVTRFKFSVNSLVFMKRRIESFGAKGLFFTNRELIAHLGLCRRNPDM